MRWWIKALAIGVAVIVVFGVVSAFLRVFYLVMAAVVIGVIVAAALRAREKLRRGREVQASDRQAEAPQAPAAPPQLEARAKAAQLQPDVEAELARLKRELQ